MEEALTDLVKEIKGTVKKITYRNESNSYTVAEVLTDGKSQTVVGILPFLTEGDEAVFYGEYTVHPSYGEQFKAERFERKAPQNSAAILRYLSSGAIKGIGPATAQKIVEKFGADTLDIIQNKPQDLATVKGITLSKAKQISEEYQKQYGVRDIMMMLSKYGATPDKCLAVYRRFGDKSTDIIKSNPYALCEEGIDFRFETAEDIAEDMSFDKNSELRVSAGVEYVLRKNLANGHTCLPREKLSEVAVKLLECKRDTVEDCCDRLTECFRIKSKTVNGTEYLSIPEYFSAEEHIAARLVSVKRYIDRAVTVDALEIENVERKLGIEFEDLQKQAIFEAFLGGILILTGGPGTGKTTTLNAIINLFENRGLDLELAAPTGRAAKRMTELTGREAKTIHRLLEVEWGEGDAKQFSRNEKNPLNCDVIIVDEASMIDALLFDSLLKALRLSCRIILVGDSDQLPAVGAGNVLNDILSSDIFPSIRLKKVFRQAGKSKIVTNAHAIINGESPDFSSKESDCFFLRRQDSFSVSNTVLELVSERLPNAYGFDPIRDIQVLCPSRMTETGTVNLNNILQSALNPNTSGKQQLSFKGIYLREGDKVMQIKNNYDLQYRRDNGEYGTGVFNGDVGFITDIDKRGGVLKVRFDDRVATYFSEDLAQLELAYAVTVHKSQGSEYTCVVLPLFDVPQKLKYRNLLYTAVTRAKKLLVAVGNDTVWTDMVANDRKTLRYTMLKQFLKEDSDYESFDKPY
ncbi:MAG: ATP-dependent RecD-like DNA helicase [Acutalibacteraceae bacterium]|nr:ATP-dependent RecD-like DNA helicase [Acutalibacteraceae bacterium]